MKAPHTPHLLAALTSVILMAGASSLQAQVVSVTYIGPTGGDNYWYAGSSWTGGVAPNNGQPTAETIYNATINNGNTVFLLSYAPRTVNNLTLSNAGLVGGGVTVNGQLTLGNGATIGNAITAQTGITFGSSVTLNGALINGTGPAPATANWGSGTLSFNNGTVINYTDSTWSAEGGLYDSVSGNNVFTNAGTFIKSSASTLTIEPTFNSHPVSTLSVNEGELRLLGGGSHDGALNVGDAATLTLGGTHTISGPLSVSSLGSFNVSSGTTTVNVPYNHSGASAISNGATLNLNGVGTHTGTFSNSGTLNFGGASRTITAAAEFSGTGAVNFQNGATTIHSASRSFDGPVRFQDGTASIGAGSTFSGVGAVNFGGGTVTTGSTFSISNPLTLSAGQWNNTGTVTATGSLTVTGGVMSDSGTVTVSGDTTFTGGTIGGSGTLNANGHITISGTNTKTLAGGHIVNAGSSTTWSGGQINAESGAVFNNNGTFTTNFGGNFSPSGGAEPHFNNAGMFIKNGAAETTTFVSGGYGWAHFNNTGTVQVNNGTLALNGTVTQHVGTTLNGGTWNVTSTPPNSSTLTFSQGSNITTIGSAASVMLDGANSTFNRLGPVTASSLTTNQGSFTLKNDRDLTTEGSLTNSGSVIIDGVPTTLTVGTGSYTQTGGQTIIVNGQIIDTNLPNLKASAFNLNGGILGGTGTIESNVITGPGSNTIAPGLSPGTLIINGSLTLSSGSTLAMELGGLTQGSLYDYLDVNGVLTLAGMLDLDFINDFQNSLTSGNILTLATADSAILGSFSNVSSGSYLMTNYPIGLQVWYGAGSPYGAENLVVAIPEPSRALLMLIGGMAMLQRRRRAVPTVI